MKLSEDQKTKILTEHYLGEGVINESAITAMGVIGVFFLIKTILNTLSKKKKREPTVEEKIIELEKGKKWCRLTRNRSECVKKINNAINNIKKENVKQSESNDIKDFDNNIKKSSVDILPNDLKDFALNWANWFNESCKNHKYTPQNGKQKQEKNRGICENHLANLDYLKELQEVINDYSDDEKLKPSGVIDFVNKRKLFMFFVCNDTYRIFKSIWFSPVDKKVYFSQGEHDAFLSDTRKPIDYKKFLKEAKDLIENNPEKFEYKYL